VLPGVEIFQGIDESFPGISLFRRGVCRQNARRLSRRDPPRPVVVIVLDLSRDCLKYIEL
jgi:hypothetical protein